MPVLSLPALPVLAYSNPNPARNRIRASRNSLPGLPIRLVAASNNNSWSPAGDFLRRLSVSSVMIIGLGVSSLWAFPPTASARISPASPSSLAHPQETLGNMYLLYLLWTIMIFCCVSRRNSLQLVGRLYFVLHCLYPWFCIQSVHSFAIGFMLVCTEEFTIMAYRTTVYAIDVSLVQIMQQFMHTRLHIVIWFSNCLLAYWW